MAIFGQKIPKMTLFLVVFFSVFDPREAKTLGVFGGQEPKNR